MTAFSTAYGNRFATPPVGAAFALGAAAFALGAADAGTLPVAGASSCSHIAFF